MMRRIFFVLCILAFQVVSGDAVAGQMPKSNSEKSSSTGIRVTRPSHPTVSKSRETVSAHGSHSAMSSPMGNHKTAPSRTKLSKSSGKVPSTCRSHNLSAEGAQTRSQKVHPSNTTTQRSSEKVATGRPASRASPKSSVSSTIRTISDQKPKPSFPRGTFPTSTKAPNSSRLEPPPAASTNSTTTQDSTRTSTLVSATKTLTISNGQTASAQIGWIVVGVGVGGSIAVEGNIIPVAGGTAGVIVAGGPGQDELDPINRSTDASTPTTSTSTSESKSSSRSTSRSTSSSTGIPTPYNIYPKLDSTLLEQSAFARDLERIAQSGSVRSITGVRDKLLLWVAALTPVQASELSRNPVVSPLVYISQLVLITQRSGVLMWIRHYQLIWKERVQVTLIHPTVLPRTARIESVMAILGCSELHLMS